MDRVVLYPTAGLSGLGLITYFVRRLLTRSPVNQAMLTLIILHSAGVVIGILLMASPFVPEIRRMISDFDIYVLIAGVAVVFVSANELRKHVW